ncbi:MAG: sugar phosphate isomerase/epimerase [Verrucomicrobiota bacterium]
MRLSLNSSTIKTTPLLDKIRVAGEAGYEGIELWAVEIYQHIGRGGEVSDVEKALADHNLEVPCFIAVRNWGETTDWEYTLALDEARRRFELAARLNCPYVVCTPPIEQPGFDTLHTDYRDLLKIGDETGVHAILEYISFFASLNNVPDTVTVMNRTDELLESSYASPSSSSSHPPKKSITILDAFHNWNSKTTLDDIRNLPLERIAHYHIDDAHPGIPSGQQKDPDRVMLGEGQIDLKSELQVLVEKGYDKWISLELFNAELWEQNPLEVAKTGIERMKKLMASL